MKNPLHSKSFAEPAVWAALTHTLNNNTLKDIIE